MAISDEIILNTLIEEIIKRAREMGYDKTETAHIIETKLRELGFRARVIA